MKNTKFDKNGGNLESFWAQLEIDSFTFILDISSNFATISASMTPKGPLGLQINSMPQVLTRLSNFKSLEKMGDQISTQSKFFGLQKNRINSWLRISGLSENMKFKALFR